MNQIASASQLRASFWRWTLLCVPGVVLLGFLSGQLAMSGPGNLWFDSLVKPAIYPPPAAFGIVWTALYVMMGLALAMVIAARGAPGRGLAIGLFAVQLVLNLAWSPLFFGARQITGALVLILVLDVAVIATILQFRKVRSMAALLLVPYLAWIAFATFLTYEFRNANPGADGRDVSGAVTRIEL